MPVNKDKKVKNKNLNVKFSQTDYEELQKIADNIGGITLSAMIRILVYFKLEEVKSSGDPRDFLMLTNHNGNEIKNKLINIKLPEEDYKKIKEIAESIGITLSAMIRILVYSQLKKVKKSKDPRDFLNMKKN